MLNLFRRHIAACPSHGKRTGQKCPRKPPCPIHYEGVDGQGKKHRSQALIDPRSGSGIRDWATACEVVRDWESPAPMIVPSVRTTIETAVAHYLNLKKTRSTDSFRRNTSLLTRFQKFMEAAPRHYQFMKEVRFPDLTDFCSSLEGANSTKAQSLGKLTSFLSYCHRAAFTEKDIGAGLSRTMQWNHGTVPREPFTAEELERIWKTLPRYAEEFGKWGPQVAQQTEAFVYVMRYTGLDVSTTLTLPKSSFRGNQILTHRLKNGSEVWTVIPEWVVKKLWEAPHDSERYFFWSGEGLPKSRACKWFSRLRILLDLAGLPHRTPHNFRHHFAVEHLLHGTPIEDVSRLLGHSNINITLKSYAAWIRLRQERLEQHQRRLWEKDPLHQRMASRQKEELPSDGVAGVS